MYHCLAIILMKTQSELQFGDPLQEFGISKGKEQRAGGRVQEILKFEWVREEISRSQATSSETARSGWLYGARPMECGTLKAQEKKIGEHLTET